MLDRTLGLTEQNTNGGCACLQYSTAEKASGRGFFSPTEKMYSTPESVKILLNDFLKIYIFICFSFHQPLLDEYEN